MQAVIDVMQKGSQASQTTISQFKEMASSTRLQTRAMSELRSEWNADNASLVMFGRAMSSVGAIGSTVLGITNTLLLANLNLEQSGSSLASSQSGLINAQEQVVAAMALYPPGSVQILQAQGNVITETNLVNQAMAQHKQTLTLTALAYVGVGLSVVGTIAQLITAAGGFSAFGTAASGALGGVTAAAAAMVIGVVTAAAIMGVAFATLFTLIDDLTNKHMTLKQAVQQTDAALAAVPVIGPALGVIGTAVTTLFSAFYALGQNTHTALVGMGTDISGLAAAVGPAVSAIGAAITSSLGTVISWATAAWTTLWSTTLPNVVRASIGNIQAGVKEALNAIIVLLNTFINAVDAFIAALNRVSGVVGIQLPVIPDIPMLAEGGIAMSPTLALIGESGPEAIVPLSGGGAPGGAGGGTTINIIAQGSIFSQNDLVTFLDQAMQQRYGLRRRTS